MTTDPFSGLFDALREEGVTVQAEIDAPSRVDGEWWADLVVDGWSTTMSWRPTSKFGVYTSDEGFGLKPDEVYAHAQKAALRLLQLRRRVERDADLPAALTLKDVRQLRALSQEVVAERLNKGQAEVSRLEAREDAKLSTIEEFVRALGGTLEISVRFDDFAGPLALRSQGVSNRRVRIDDLHRLQASFSPKPVADADALPPIEDTGAVNDLYELSLVAGEVNGEGDAPPVLLGSIWLNGKRHALALNEEARSFFLSRENTRYSCAILAGVEYLLEDAEDEGYRIVGLKQGDVSDIFDAHETREGSAHAK